MKLFAKALEAMDNATDHDASYCKKLSYRFESMGIDAAQASNAVCTLLEKDAVPQPGSWVATPSMFKGGMKAATPAEASEMEAVLA